MSTSETVLFWILAPIAVAGALTLLLSKRAVVTAISVVMTMVSLAFLYVGLGAPFLGVVQVVVYTGAIMMLFVFVLMLVGVDVSDSFVETIRGQRPIGLLLGLGLTAVLVGAAWRASFPAPLAPIPSELDNPGQVAAVVFRDYPFTLEIVGTLLIIAAVGAVIMTHRLRLRPRAGQRELSQRRIAEGSQIPPLPAPGVFARHNAADIPALDASGRPIESSVPQVLRVRGQVAAAGRYASGPVEIEGPSPRLLDQPTEPVTEAATDPVAEPGAEASTDPTTEPTTEPAPGPGAEPKEAQP